MDLTNEEREWLKTIVARELAALDKKAESVTSEQAKFAIRWARMQAEGVQGKIAPAART